MEVDEVKEFDLAADCDDLKMKNYYSNARVSVKEQLNDLQKKIRNNPEFFSNSKYLFIVN